LRLFPQNSQPLRANAVAMPPTISPRAVAVMPIPITPSASIQQTFAIL